MTKIRVLVVDDSVVVRRLLLDALAEDPEIEVVGTAANGKIALAKIAQERPDVVTMDIEMPEMDGIETLRALKEAKSRVPVIMFSTLTQRGGAATLDAISLGAADYVTKPSNVGNVTQAREALRDELVPKVKALYHKTKEREKPIPAVARPQCAMPVQPAVVPPTARRPAANVKPVSFEALAIGVSTGGPQALLELIPRLPKDFHLAVFIVQHMPALFTRLLAERLDSKSNLTVKEASEGALVTPGSVWVAPGDFHMTVVRTGKDVRLHLDQRPPENSCRPAADPLFRSVAECYGEKTIALVMTGMGQDGLAGCESVRKARGHILVQDEKSSVVWGMPGFVARAGLADAVIPLDLLAEEVLNRVRRDSPSLTEKQIPCSITTK